MICLYKVSPFKCVTRLFFPLGFSLSFKHQKQVKTKNIFNVELIILLFQKTKLIYYFFTVSPQKVDRIFCKYCTEQAGLMLEVSPLCWLLLHGPVLRVDCQPGRSSSHINMQRFSSELFIK